jgi:hypothetical protein
MVFTALVMGLVLLLIRRWELPPGSLALIFTINAIMLASKLGTTQYPITALLALAGVAAEGWRLWLKPSPARGRAFRLFAVAVPVTLYVLYFGALLAAGRMEWPVTI